MRGNLSFGVGPAQGQVKVGRALARSGAARFDGRLLGLQRAVGHQRKRRLQPLASHSACGQTAVVRYSLRVAKILLSARASIFQVELLFEARLSM